jgi:uncharacterized surface protein with fasciclin (FAS1) repeats
MRPKHMGVTVAAAGLSLAAAACGSSAPSASSGTSVGTHRISAQTGTFGTGCAKVPRTGMGSFSGMAGVPVATAASHNPLLSDLVRAVQAAGLTNTLNSAKSITVFAPDNAAFAQLGSKNVGTLMGNRADLTKVLEYHVVQGRKTPADLATGKELRTLLGLPIHPAKRGDTYAIGNAQIICGNVQTSNATVYIIDRVLLP